jgi:thymidine kinase
MTSICEICKRDNAIFSFYKGCKKSGDIELGDAEYVTVCRECYNEMVEKFKDLKQQ